ncbi:MAG TPA: hypothetical protein VFB09_06140 [Actinomycetota bacterium]|nr:hypothetical protein [Actinomycetota bacterium]
MTPGSNFDDRLHDWFEEGPTDAPGQVLDTVLAAVPSIPQRRASWRVPRRISPMFGFARALAGVAIAVGLGTALFFVLRPTPGGVGGEASPSPSAVAVVPPTPVPSAPVLIVTPAPAPTAVEPCNPANLDARITMWEGAMGHRIAHVELTNSGFSACIIQAKARPQLVDANRSILIDGSSPAAPDPFLTMAPGGILKTLVQDGNYCGPTPVAPVTVAFVLADGSRILTAPFSPTDANMPPCLGSGSKADIEMQPWAP